MQASYFGSSLPSDQRAEDDDDDDADGEEEDDQAPLDLSRRDHAEGSSTAKDNDTQDEMPLNLCMKPRPSSPAPSTPQTHSPAPNSSPAPSQASEASSVWRTYEATGEHSDQRETAAFALCQLACSSPESQDSATCSRNTGGAVSLGSTPTETSKEPDHTANTELEKTKVCQTQTERVETRNDAPKRTSKKTSARQPSHIPKKRPRCS